jgi:hypothetical protein
MPYPYLGGRGRYENIEVHAKARFLIFTMWDRRHIPILQLSTASTGIASPLLIALLFLHTIIYFYCNSI